jgi:hypothetical protein
MQITKGQKFKGGQLTPMAYTWIRPCPYRALVLGPEEEGHIILGTAEVANHAQCCRQERLPLCAPYMDDQA